MHTPRTTPIEKLNGDHSIVGGIQNRKAPHVLFIALFARGRQETCMLDMNRVLTQMLGGDAGSEKRQSAAPRGTATGAAVPAHWPLAGHEHHPPAQSGGMIEKLVPLGTGALAAGLAARLFGSKRLRGVSGTALQVGAVAAIGGLAYKAYQNYQQGRPVIPETISSALSSIPKSVAGKVGPHTPGAWVPVGPQADERARLLLSAMVSAAASDGHLDGVEYSRIRAQLLKQGWSEEEQLFLSQVLLKPPTIEELAVEATSLAQRVEVYTAARLAIDADAPSEHEWLDRLAKALALEAGLKAHLDAIGTEREAAAA